jgi:hypothetical protein
MAVKEVGDQNELQCMKHWYVVLQREAKLAVCPTQLALEDGTMVIVLLTLRVGSTLSLKKIMWITLIFM